MSVRNYTSVSFQCSILTCVRVYIYNVTRNQGCPSDQHSPMYLKALNKLWMRLHITLVISELCMYEIKSYASVCIVQCTFSTFLS